MIVRLKRTFRPLRPVLNPLWVRVAPYVEHGFRLPGSPQHRAVVDIPPPGTIRPITDAEFDRLLQLNPYYRRRREYIAVARAAAGRLIAEHDLHTALELGPNIRSVIAGADVMELRARAELESEARVVIHDARVAPWPAADKAYDLFVALQVFEHLKGRQREAFGEIRRVARHAIISLPIDWETEDPRDIHRMIPEERVLGWFAPIVPTEVLVGNPAPQKRIVYVFEALPAP